MTRAPARHGLDGLAAEPKETVQVAEDVSDSPAGFAKEQLKSFIERIERLEEEKKAIADDIKDVFAEAKANGFDVKALRTILKIRKEDVDERKEHEAIVDLYMQALGIFV
ncbi:hypothetical protein XFLAVUS301_02370 [Xanthobacter flavus]|uniref:UPF0335 protein XFLAVUS301_02370 n=1 Tax=Xanthobacter flavus TaxID=281 RepID=A0A9W6CE30_XANFL|nr:hypothetical protein XFLAVUS301_02370 [Xanthobacter flavus]